MGWKLYDVEGAGRPLALSPEHAAALGAREHGTGAVVPPRPADSARKADWVEWAVTVHDLDSDVAECMTKAQLQGLA